MNMEINGYMKELKMVKTKGVILCCKYSDDRKLWIAGFSNGQIGIYSGKSEIPEALLKDDDTADINNSVTGITNKNDSTNHAVYASYSGGLIKKWNYKTQNCLFTINENRQTLGIVYHPKLDKIFTLGDDGKINMYDEETQKCQQVYGGSEKNINDGHSSRVFALCFNPANLSEFVSGGWDASILFWDVRQAHACRKIDDVYIGGEGLTVNSQGTQLVSCAWRRENPMQVWDYSTGQLIKNITPDSQTSQLYCGKYINDKFVATGGCETNVFRVIDTASFCTVTSVVNLSGGVYSVDFKSPTGGAKGANLAKVNDVSDLPHMLFCSAKNLYEIQFK